MYFFKIGIIYDSNSLYLFDDQDKQLLSINYFEEEQLTSEEKEIKNLDENFQLYYVY